MSKFLNKIMVSCRTCFTRDASFCWFVVIVVGLMVCQEHLGVTSIVRELYLNPNHYETLLHSFRSSGWNMRLLSDWWIRVVWHSPFLYREANMPIMVGDDVKASKAAKKMPCVKKHRDSSSGSYIFGHMFGALGLLVGIPEKLFCVLLFMRVHNGDA